jgi:uncharacterized cupin superfamily protein
VKNPTHAVEGADAGAYEPFIHRGVATGEIRPIAVAGSRQASLDAGLWRSEPATYDYLFEADETFVVLEGSATIALPDSDEIVEVSAGDVAYFVGGTRSVWTITRSFRKFVVVAGEVSPGASAPA